MARLPFTLAVTLATGLLAAACSPQGKPKKSGAPVATGNGITITAEDFKERLDEQSPFIRARYSTLERKKEFLENLIQFEVLAKEAERQGLAKDPDVQNTLKKIMVQKLVQKNFQDGPGAEPTEAELQKYYDDHRDEYVRPRRVRVSAIVIPAASGPERAAKAALAQKALAKVRAEEKTKGPAAFAQAVAEFSQDPVSKALSGDLQFRSKEELEKTYSKPLAEAAFSLKPAELSGVVNAPEGFYVLKHMGEQPELDRPFDQMRAQISNKLQRERKSKEFDEWRKKLREAAKIRIDEKALEAVEVQAGGVAPGMPGPMGHGAPMAAPPPPPAAPAAPQTR